MGNILSAIQAIVENSSISVESSQDGVQNRANQMGDALEDYVKNAFANCFGMDKRATDKARSLTFSYLGNSNNPPDAMLWEGDAIEIKKLKTIGTSQLQLNSSYPKNKLYSSNTKISNECRTCEKWEEKDILYVVGHVDNDELRSIFFIYGDLYCDSPDVYEKVEKVIKDGLESLEGVELADTNELGRVNKVDHLEISDLRVRGMWLIKTPFQHFAYLTEEIKDYSFKLVAVIPEGKYQSFDNVQDFEDFCREHNVSIANESLPNPKNPAELINSKLITYFFQ